MKKIIFSPYHFLLSLAGALIYSFPSKRIRVIGITGTKGKTTTVAICRHIFTEAGKSVASLSSVYKTIGDEVNKNRTGNSMPGRFFIQKFLADAVQKGCTHAIIEVTSQGTVQHRHRNILWAGAAFLGIHPEHIESHGSFKKYCEAKRAFFTYAAKHHREKISFFVNKNDAEAEGFIKAAGNLPCVLLSSRDDVYKEGIQLPQCLKGDFNRINIATAVAIARAEGIEDNVIKSALESFSGVAGRMEVIIEHPQTVIVDYAHTPESLRAIYSHARSFKKERSNKLICILGSAGGGRDAWKRPELGSIAGELCDHIILTDEDPYDEDPKEIVYQVRSGVLIHPVNDGKLDIILDRRAAFERAKEIAEEGDVVVATGKGSEEWIHGPRGTKIEWSDSKVAKDIFRKN